MNSPLLLRAKRHDWDSLEARDLMERIDLVKELGKLPLRELNIILKDVGPRSAITIIDLVNRFERIKR